MTTLIVIILLITITCNYGAKQEVERGRILFMETDAKRIPINVSRWLKSPFGKNHEIIAVEKQEDIDKNIRRLDTSEGQKLPSIVKVSAIQLPNQKLPNVLPKIQDAQWVNSRLHNRISSIVRPVNIPNSQINHKPPGAPTYNFKNVQPRKTFVPNSSPPNNTPFQNNGLNKRFHNVKPNYTSSESFDLVTSALGGLSSLKPYFQAPSARPILNRFLTKPIQRIALPLKNEKPHRLNVDVINRFPEPEVVTAKTQGDFFDNVKEITVMSSMNAQDEAVNMSSSAIQNTRKTDQVERNKLRMSELFSQSSPTKITKANLLENKARSKNNEVKPTGDGPEYPDFIDYGSDDDDSLYDIVEERSISMAGKNKPKSLESTNKQRTNTTNSMPSSVDVDYDPRFVDLQKLNKTEEKNEVDPLSAADELSVKIIEPSPMIITKTEMQTITETETVQKTMAAETKTSMETMTITLKTTMHNTEFDTVTYTSRVYQRYVSTSYVPADCLPRTKTRTIRITKTECPNYSTKDAYFSNFPKYVRDSSENLDELSTRFLSKKVGPPLTEKRQTFHIDADGVPQNERKLTNSEADWPSDFIIDDKLWNWKS